jgi:protein-disulfide isomerase
MRKLIQSVPIVVASASLAACVTRADIEEIKENQKKILEKVEKGGTAARARPQRPRGPDPGKTYAVSLGQAPIKGPADAWVTIVEGSEFQCPYCSRVNPTIEQVMKKYGKDVRVAFKHNPLGFHPNAMPAANASACAQEQGRFWEMHDQLFANQKQLSDTKYKEIARQIGIDVDRWQKCYDAKKYQNRIQQDQRTLTQFGARGTPAFFINGRFLSGAQPATAFERIIDEELAKAKKSGIPQKDYYQKAVVDKGEKRI